MQPSCRVTLMSATENWEWKTIQVPAVDSGPGRRFEMSIFVDPFQFRFDMAWWVYKGF